MDASIFIQCLLSASMHPDRLLIVFNNSLLELCCGYALACFQICTESAHSILRQQSELSERLYEGLEFVMIGQSFDALIYLTHTHVFDPLNLIVSLIYLTYTRERGRHRI